LLLFPQADMSALNVMTFGDTFTAFISRNNSKASFGWLHFSQTEIMALYVKTSGAMCVYLFFNSRKTWKALSSFFSAAHAD
jgi:hypothetical protein